MDPFDELALPRSGRQDTQALSSASLASPQDLIAKQVEPSAQAGLQGSPRQIMRPMRPPPPPPTAQPAAAVDGVPQAALDVWFQIADRDSDGRVANAEVVEFFLQSGLDALVLSKIYSRVKTPELSTAEGVGLNKHRFAQMLRLVALVQSGHELNDQNAAAALDSAAWLARHGRPLPPPRIQLKSAAAQAMVDKVLGSPFSSSGLPGSPAPLSASPPSRNPFGGASPASAMDVAVLGDMVAHAQQAAVAAPGPSSGAQPLPQPPQQQGEEDVDDDLFGIKKLRAALPQQQCSTGPPQPAAEAAANRSRSPSPMKRLTRMSEMSARRLDLQQSGSKPGAILEAPLAIEVRLPPLNPKQSAKLCMLAAGNGSLFAGPGNKNCLLQWGHAEDNVRQPEGTEQAPGGELLVGQNPSALSALPRAEQEDWDAAPSVEVQATPRKQATSLLVDSVSNVLWVGDKDGWVTGYDISGKPGVVLSPSKKLYQWEAYRVGSVTAMCVTPHGELWTGSSRGNIRVWELPPRGSAFGGQVQEVPQLLCRELRRCRPPGDRPHGSGVLALVCPSSGHVVWGASLKSITLWEAASGAFLGTYQPVVNKFGQGHVLDQAKMQTDALLRVALDPQKGLEVDPLTGALQKKKSPTERAKLRAEQVAYAKQTDKGVSQLVEHVNYGGSKVVQSAGKAMKVISKFGAKLAQNLGGTGEGSDGMSSKSGSYNPAEDDVAPPVPRGKSFMEDRSSRMCAVVATHDSHVWVGYKKGKVECYTASGLRVWAKETASTLETICCVGRQMWLGFSNGMLSILDSNGTSLKVFSAHSAGIISMAQAGTRTYTLAADGSIKGWSSLLPTEADTEALAQWERRAAECIRQDTIHMLCLTWNVGESKPSLRSPFFTQLDGKVNVSHPDIQLVAVGLQEIEMGSSSVALAAAKDALATRMQERGNTNAKFWGASILEALGGEQRWYQVALRQLSGMLVLVFARTGLRNCIGEVATASVACGVLGVGGNKGAVAVEFTLHRRKLAIVCSHFAAHQKAVKERNANYELISKVLTFKRKPWFQGQGSDSDDDVLDMPQPAGASKRKVDASDDTRWEEGSDEVGLEPGEELIQGEGMRNARLLVWMGDFNYRIDDYSYAEVKEEIQRENWGPLLEKDQCRQQVAAGNVFRGLQEGGISFRPTYKFDKGDPNPEAYDTSEKQRIPAWCDRVFFRGSPPEEEAEGLEVVAVKAEEYNAWLDVLDSDHKPVFARLEVTLPVTDRSKKRHISSRLLAECTAEVQQAGAPEGVELLPLRKGVRLNNGGQHAVRFRVVVDKATAFDLGRSVDVLPLSGLVRPGSSVDIFSLLTPLDQDVIWSQELEPRVVVGGSGIAKLRQVEVQVLLQPEFSCCGELWPEQISVLPFQLEWGN